MGKLFIITIRMLQKTIFQEGPERQVIDHKTNESNSNSFSKTISATGQSPGEPTQICKWLDNYGERSEPKIFLLAGG
jgi:hypothetical protein